MRAAHTVLGSVIGVVWLMFPWMTISGQDPVPAARAGPVAEAAAPPERDETSPVDLILPLAVAAAAGVLATYAYVRRTRRARTRTTPGVVSAHPPVPTPAGLERQARTALVVADDSVRTSEEELAFAQARFGAEEVEPFTHALAAARTELSAAFAIRRRYEQGVPADDAARRQALVGIVGRCAEAGRRLDAEAEATLAGLRARYASSATAPVLGHSEQAKDRLVFATAELNRARRTADSGAVAQAARPLRAAEGAIAQAGVFVRGVERLSAELAEAAKLVPAALTGAEAELATARGWGAPDASVPVGELHARIRHADVVLAAVRHELTGAPYDPLDALRRIARAVEPLGVGRAGVVPVAARLVARSAVGGAADFVSTHRGAVGAEARTLLAEAERLLAARNEFAAADGLARQARESAEQDVRVHGNPYDATGEQAGGAAGALLGGILLGEEADGGPPASFGGPGTRGRRRLPRG